MARRKLKKALESVGHGKVHSRKVRPKQEFVKIKGVKKKITKGNRRGGKIFWYMRSDTNKPALRNFKRDRSIKATHRAIRKKGNTGD